jgi:hypothetical protein
MRAKGLREIITCLRLHEGLTSIRPLTLKWARNICDNPTELLKPLAKEHVRNWFSKVDTEEAEEGFEFAREALKSVRVYPHEPPLLSRSFML